MSFRSFFNVFQSHHGADETNSPDINDMTPDMIGRMGARQAKLEIEKARAAGVEPMFKNPFMARSKAE